MKSITRKIDNLGRIVLPMDFRRALGLEQGNEVALDIEGDKITIKGALNVCKLCGKHIEKRCYLSICEECIAKVKEISEG